VKTPAFDLESVDIQFIHGFPNFLLQLQYVENGSGESFEGKFPLLHRAKYCIAILLLTDQLFFCCSMWIVLGLNKFENASSSQAVKAGEPDLALQMARSQS
jgi:hypothetical protein